MQEKEAAAQKIAEAEQRAEDAKHRLLQYGDVFKELEDLKASLDTSQRQLKDEQRNTTTLKMKHEQQISELHMQIASSEQREQVLQTDIKDHRRY